MAEGTKMQMALATTVLLSLALLTAAESGHQQASTDQVEEPEYPDQIAQETLPLHTLASIDGLLTDSVPPPEDFSAVPPDPLTLPQVGTSIENSVATNDPQLLSQPPQEGREANNDVPVDLSNPVNPLVPVASPYPPTHTGSLAQYPYATPSQYPYSVTPATSPRFLNPYGQAHYPYWGSQAYPGFDPYRYYDQQMYYQQLRSPVDPSKIPPRQTSYNSHPVLPTAIFAPPERPEPFALRRTRTRPPLEATVRPTRPSAEAPTPSLESYSGNIDTSSNDGIQNTAPEALKTVSSTPFQPNREQWNSKIFYEIEQAKQQQEQNYTNSQELQAIDPSSQEQKETPTPETVRQTQTSTHNLTSSITSSDKVNLPPSPHDIDEIYQFEESEREESAARPENSIQLQPTSTVLKGIDASRYEGLRLPYYSVVDETNLQNGNQQILEPLDDVDSNLFNQAVLAFEAQRTSKPAVNVADSNTQQNVRVPTENVTQNVNPAVGNDSTISNQTLPSQQDASQLPGSSQLPDFFDPGLIDYINALYRAQAAGINPNEYDYYYDYDSDYNFSPTGQFQRNPNFAPPQLQSGVSQTPSGQPALPPTGFFNPWSLPPSAPPTGQGSQTGAFVPQGFLPPNIPVGTGFPGSGNRNQTQAFAFNPFIYQQQGILPYGINPTQTTFINGFQTTPQLPAITTPRIRFQDDTDLQISPSPNPPLPVTNGGAFPATPPSITFGTSTPPSITFEPSTTPVPTPTGSEEIANGGNQSTASLLDTVGQEKDPQLTTEIPLQNISPIAPPLQVSPSKDASLPLGVQGNLPSTPGTVGQNTILNIPTEDGLLNPLNRPLPTTLPAQDLAQTPATVSQDKPSTFIFPLNGVSLIPTSPTDVLPEQGIQEQPPVKAEAVPRQPTIPTQAVPEQSVVPAQPVPQDLDIQEVSQQTGSQQPVVPTQAIPQQPGAPAQAVPQQPSLPASSISQQPIAPELAVPQQTIVQAQGIPQQPAIPSISAPQQTTVPAQRVPQQPVVPAQRVPQQPAVPVQRVPQQPAVPAQRVPQPPAVPAQRVPQQPVVPAQRVPQQPAVPAQRVPQQPAVPAQRVPQQPAVPVQRVPQQPAVPAQRVPQPPAVPAQRVPQQPVVPAQRVPQQPAVPAQRVPQQPAVPAQRVPQQPAVPAQRVPQQPAVPAQRVPQQPAVPAQRVPQQPVVPAQRVPQQPVVPAQRVPQQPVVPAQRVPQQPAVPAQRVPQQPAVPAQRVPQQPVVPAQRVPQQPAVPAQRVTPALATPQQAAVPVQSVPQRPVVPALATPQQTAVPVQSVPQQPVVPALSTPQQAAVPVQGVRQQPVVPAISTPQQAAVPVQSVPQHTVVPALAAPQQPVIPVQSVPQQPVVPVLRTPQQLAVPVQSVPQQPVVPALATPQQSAIPVQSVPQRPVVPALATPQQAAVPVQRVPQQPVVPALATPQQPAIPVQSVPQRPVVPALSTPQQAAVPVQSVPQQPVVPALAIPQQAAVPVQSVPQRPVVPALATPQQAAVPVQSVPQRPVVPALATPQQTAVPVQSVPQQPVVPALATPQQAAVPVQSVPQRPVVPALATPQQAAVPVQSVPKGPVVPALATPQQAAVPVQSVPQRPVVPALATPQQAAVPVQSVPQQPVVPALIRPQQTVVPLQRVPEQPDLFIPQIPATQRVPTIQTVPPNSIPGLSSPVTNKPTSSKGQKTRVTRPSLLGVLTPRPSTGVQNPGITPSTDTRGSSVPLKTFMDFFGFTSEQKTTPKPSTTGGENDFAIGSGLVVDSAVLQDLTSLKNLGARQDATTSNYPLDPSVLNSTTLFADLTEAIRNTINPSYFILTKHNYSLPPRAGGRQLDRQPSEETDIPDIIGDFIQAQRLTPDAHPLPKTTKTSKNTKMPHLISSLQAMMDTSAKQSNGAGKTKQTGNRPSYNDAIDEDEFLLLFSNKSPILPEEGEYIILVPRPSEVKFSPEIVSSLGASAEVISQGREFLDFAEELRAGGQAKPHSAVRRGVPDLEPVNDRIGAVNLSEETEDAEPQRSLRGTFYGPSTDPANLSWLAPFSGGFGLREPQKLPKDTEIPSRNLTNSDNLTDDDYEDFPLAESNTASVSTGPTVPPGYFPPTQDPQVFFNPLATGSYPAYDNFASPRPLPSGIRSPEQYGFFYQGQFPQYDFPIPTGAYPFNFALANFPGSFPGQDNQTPLTFPPTGNPGNPIPPIPPASISFPDYGTGASGGDVSANTDSAVSDYPSGDDYLTDTESNYSDYDIQSENETSANVLSSSEPSSIESNTATVPVGVSIVDVVGSRGNGENTPNTLGGADISTQITFPGEAGTLTGESVSHSRNREDQENTFDIPSYDVNYDQIFPDRESGGSQVTGSGFGSSGGIPFDYDYLAGQGPLGGEPIPSTGSITDSAVTPAIFPTGNIGTSANNGFADINFPDYSSENVPPIPGNGVLTESQEIPFASTPLSTDASVFTEAPTFNNNGIPLDNNGFTPDDNVFTVGSIDKTPDDSVFASQTSRVTPDSNIFSTLGSDFTLEDNAFTTESSVFTPIDNSFLIRTSNFIPEDGGVTPAFNAGVTEVPTTAGTDSSDIPLPGVPTEFPVLQDEESLLSDVMNDDFDTTTQSGVQDLSFPGDESTTSPSIDSVLGIITTEMPDVSTPENNTQSVQEDQFSEQNAAAPNEQTVVALDLSPKETRLNEQEQNSTQGLPQTEETTEIQDVSSVDVNEQAFVNSQVNMENQPNVIQEATMDSGKENKISNNDTIEENDTIQDADSVLVDETDTQVLEEIQIANNTLDNASDSEIPPSSFNDTTIESEVRQRPSLASELPYLQLPEGAYAFKVTPGEINATNNAVEGIPDDSSQTEATETSTDIPDIQNEGSENGSNTKGSGISLDLLTGNGTSEAEVLIIGSGEVLPPLQNIPGRVESVRGLQASPEEVLLVGNSAENTGVSLPTEERHRNSSCDDEETIRSQNTETSPDFPSQEPIILLDSSVELVSIEDTGNEREQGIVQNLPLEELGLKLATAKNKGNKLPNQALGTPELPNIVTGIPNTGVLNNLSPTIVSPSPTLQPVTETTTKTVYVPILTSTNTPTTTKKVTSNVKQQSGITTRPGVWRPTFGIGGQTQILLEAMKKEPNLGSLFGGSYQRPSPASTGNFHKQNLGFFGTFKQKQNLGLPTGGKKQTGSYPGSNNQHQHYGTSGYQNKNQQNAGREKWVWSNSFSGLPARGREEEFVRNRPNSQDDYSFSSISSALESPHNSYTGSSYSSGQSAQSNYDEDGENERWVWTTSRRNNLPNRSHSQRTTWIPDNYLLGSSVINYVYSKNGSSTLGPSTSSTLQKGISSTQLGSTVPTSQPYYWYNTPTSTDPRTSSASRAKRSHVIFKHS